MTLFRAIPKWPHQKAITFCPGVNWNHGRYWAGVREPGPGSPGLCMWLSCSLPAKNVLLTTTIKWGLQLPLSLKMWNEGMYGNTTFKARRFLKVSGQSPCNGKDELCYVWCLSLSRQQWGENRLLQGDKNQPSFVKEQQTDEHAVLLVTDCCLHASSSEQLKRSHLTDTASGSPEGYTDPWNRTENGRAGVRAPFPDFTFSAIHGLTAR